MTRQANNTKEELTRVLAQPNLLSVGIIPDGIPQRELKKKMNEMIYNEWGFWLSNGLNYAKKKILNDAFIENVKKVCETKEPTWSFNLLKNILMDFHDIWNISDDEVNEKAEKYIHREISNAKHADFFKNLSISTEWTDVKIKQLSLLINVPYEILQILASGEDPRPKSNIPAEAILESRPMFMTLNRVNQLDAFKTKLSKEKVLLVAGERGSGKTLFVNVFIQKHHSDYKHIIYVIVKAGQIIEGFVKSIGDYLGVQIQSDESSLEQLRVALMLLKNHNLSGLICIDNANTPGALETFLKEWEKYPFLKDSINLVITTYCRTEKAANFELDALEKTNAKEIFENYVKRNEAKQLVDKALSLFEIFKFNPILVEQFSLLLENNHRIKDFSGIEELLKKKAQQPIISNPGTTNKFYNNDELLIVDFIKALFGEMAESITTIKDKTIIQYYSLLPAKTYFEHELIDIMPITENDLERIDELVRKGWLLKKGNGFYCHELYQIAIREIFKSDVSDLVPLFAKLVEKIRLDDISNMDREIVDVLTYVPVVDSVVSNITYQRELISFEENDLQHKLSVFETKHSQFENDHIVLATLLESLGLAYALLSKRDDALQYLYDSVCMRLRLNQENTWEFVDNLRRLANVVKLDNIKEALKILEGKTKNALINRFETPIFIRIRFYTSLGNIYREMGDLEKAEEKLNEGLVLCGNNPRYQFDKATILDNLGFVYSTKGRVEEKGSAGSEAAKKCFESSIAFRENALNLRKNIHKSQDNLKVATLHNNLGAVYSRLEKMQDCINAYANCIEIRENLNLPKVHNSFAVVKNNLAIAYAKKVSFNQCSQDEKEGLLNKANAFYESAMDIRKQLLKEGDFKFGHNLYAKAWILMEQGKLKNDINLLNEALESAKAAIVFKNKKKAPVQHEIQEVEDLMEKIKIEINKPVNEPTN